MSWTLINLVSAAVRPQLTRQNGSSFHLTSYANENGENVYPSVGRIARETSLTPRGVHNVLERLKRKQFIVCTGRFRRGVVAYKVNVAVLVRETQDASSRNQVLHSDPPLNEVQRIEDQPLNDVQWIIPLANEVQGSAERGSPAR